MSLRFKIALFVSTVILPFYGCSSIYNFMFDAGGDSTKPYIVLETPVNGTKVATNVTVTGSAKGVRAKLKRITIYYQSTNGAISGNAPAGLFLGKFASSVDLSSYGFFYLWAEAEDELGNIADTAENKVLVNAANIPIIQFSVPVSNGREHYTNITAVPFTLSSFIVGALVTNVRFFVDYNGSSSASFDVASGSVSSNIVLSNNSTNRISAVAFSDNGEQSQTQFVCLYVDTVAPNIALNAPTNGQFVNNQFNVTVTANDPQISGIDRVELTIDGTNRGQSSVYPYNVTWDTSSDPEAAHTVLVTAYDLAGNFTSASNTVSIIQAVCVSVGSGSDANFGYKTSPMKSILSAITQAVRLGINQVYVSAETYTPGNGLWTNNSGIIIATNNFRLIGGFGPAFTNRSGYSELDASNSLYHVISITNATNVYVDGFVVRSGFASNVSYPNYSGGGINILYGTNITVTNCLVSNCTAKYGGGLAVFSSKNLTVHSDFVRNVSTNSSSGRGGGLYMEYSCNCDIRGDFISNNLDFTNYASTGGGIYLYFVNTASVNGNVSYNLSYDGGGAYLLGNYMDIGADFTGNYHYSTVEGGGGCFACGRYFNFTGNFTSNYTRASGGGLFMQYCSNFTLSGNYAGNTADYSGGGIALDKGGYGDINANVIGNIAYTSYGNGYGAGVYVLGDHVNITGNILSNRAEGNPAIVGGMFLHGNYINVNATIAYNYANDNASSGPALLIWGNSNSVTGAIVNNHARTGYYRNTCAIYANTMQNLVLTNLVISNNYNSGGGAYTNENTVFTVLYLVNGYYPNQVLISNCTIAGPSGSRYPAIQVKNTNLNGFTLKDCVFKTNAIGPLFLNFDGTTVSNDAWTNINDPVFLGASEASGNRVTN